MGRYLAIDYGTKRVGLAVTDPLKLIASPLDTVPTEEIIAYLINYVMKEKVELFVLGLPKNLDNSDAESMPGVRLLSKKLYESFPDIPQKWVDERYTSKLAMRSMIEAGVKKSDRRKKENTDKVSAAIILQSYMEELNFYSKY